MLAKMKCSNCGAEISNLSMSWGRKYWLFIVPLVLLSMYPMLRMTFSKGDFREDLSISQIETRESDGGRDVLGIVTNNGTRPWSSLKIEVEFFDKEGRFLDQETAYLMTEIAPGAKEHFKVTVRGASAEVDHENSEMVVKVADANSMPF